MIYFIKKINKKGCQKWGNVPVILGIVYRKGGFKLLHTKLWTWAMVMWTKLGKYDLSASWAFVGFLSAISLNCGQLLGDYRVNSLSHLILITGHWECCNKAGFLSQSECLVWFELGIFLFDHSTLNQQPALPPSQKKNIVHGDCLHLIPSLVFLF